VIDLVRLVRTDCATERGKLAFTAIIWRGAVWLGEAIPQTHVPFNRHD
jgi:hypothetical protein